MLFAASSMAGTKLSSMPSPTSRNVAPILAVALSRRLPSSSDTFAAATSVEPSPSRNSSIVSRAAVPAGPISARPGTRASCVCSASDSFSVLLSSASSISRRNPTVPFFCKFAWL